MTCRARRGAAAGTLRPNASLGGTNGWASRITWRGSGARRPRRPLAGGGSAGFDGKALAGPCALSVAAAACSRGGILCGHRVLPEWTPGLGGSRFPQVGWWRGGPRRGRRSGLRESVPRFPRAPTRVPPPLPSGLALGSGWGHAAGLSPSTRCSPSPGDRPAQLPERLRSARDPALPPPGRGSPG